MECSCYRLTAAPASAAAPEKTDTAACSCSLAAPAYMRLDSWAVEVLDWVVQADQVPSWRRSCQEKHPGLVTVYGKRRSRPIAPSPQDEEHNPRLHLGFDGNLIR